jgi:Icc-related predicted phosphoesterase
MSDSHNQHRRLPKPVPDGDVFIHAGDFGCLGKEGDVRDFGSWVRRLPHKHKIIIAGNHDMTHESRPGAARGWMGDGFTYLMESGTEIDGVRFWGQPYTPTFGGWAFMRDRAGMRESCAKIPSGTDVLTTHGPPRGVLDLTIDGVNAGCPELRETVESRVRPRVHVFGHIHDGGGQSVEMGPTRFYNVAVCGPMNRMERGCTVIDL